MLLRKALLEEELMKNQLHYDKVFRVSQVSSEIEKRAMQCILDGILFEIADLRKELDMVNVNNKVLGITAK